MVYCTGDCFEEIEELGEGEGLGYVGGLLVGVEDEFGDDGPTCFDDSFEENKFGDIL